MIVLSCVIRNLHFVYETNKGTFVYNILNMIISLNSQSDLSGPSCFKLMTSLVKVSLKF